MKALVTGAAGQLGRELLRYAPAGWDVVALDRACLDITGRDAVARVLAAHGAAVVVNAAAYNAVDQAEDEPGAAAAANVTGPENLARECARSGARFVHVSSDYVFDGDLGRPYAPEDRTEPRSVYGRTKRDGELAVLAANPGTLVVRSAWLYSAHGSNFVKTILRQSRERNELRVVTDQVGSPTWAAGLADVLWRLAGRPEVSGILHFADAGVASRYDFASAIVEEALVRGLLPGPVSVQPVMTTDYPSRARRPAFSVLDSRRTRQLLGLPAVHWRAGLRAMLDELASAKG